MTHLFLRLLRKFSNIGIIQKIIIIYIITIIIPMLIIQSISYANSVNMIRDEIQSALFNLSMQINNNVEDWLKKMDNLTSILYSKDFTSRILRSSKYKDDSLDLLEDNREFNKFFINVLSQSSEIESIYVFTKNNNVFYKSNTGSMKLNYNPEGESWYKETLEKKGKISFYGLHTPWPLSNSNTRVFSIARQIRDMDGQILGVILIDIKLDSLGILVKKSVNKYHSHFIVIDNLQNVLYNDNNYDMDNALNKKALGNLINSDSHTSKGIMNNQSVFLTYMDSSFSGWRIISITPNSYIDMKSIELLRLNVIITIISFIVFSLLLILLYLTIYKPIHRLNLSMKKVQAGDFDITVAEGAMDEIGQLCVNFNGMISKINSLIDSEYKSTILRKDAEFKALQSQINPHFLYNTLQLISSIAVVKKVPEINEASMCLGYMLRYSIKTKGDFVPFNLELEHVKSYIAIQKMRLEEKVLVTIDIDDRVIDLKIMKLILQPFVENAFNHGIGKSRNIGLIELSVKLDDESIFIKVKDNGIGMDKEKLALLKQSLDISTEQNIIGSEVSIGIHNVNSRLNLFYGSKYDLGIESRLGTGTEITIRVPANKYEVE